MKKKLGNKTHTENLSDIEKMKMEELICHAQSGSSVCFAELVNRFGPRLFHFFRHKVAQDCDVDDLVQETFVKAYSKLHLYKPQYQFSTWLYAIGINEVANFYRLKQKHATVIERNESIADDPGDTIIKKEDKDYLWEKARQLPGKGYDLLWLKYAEGMSIKEMASVLRMTQVNVKVQLFRARRGMQKLCSNWFEK